MKPRGQLMIEHRLIEKMLKLIENEVSVIKTTGSVDVVFIDTIVDFIKVYADRTHHGKEEDILFKDLENKKLNTNDKKIMQELIDEHILARKKVSELVEANNNYSKGDTKSIDIIIETLTFLTEFYPVHIIKEDKVFFPDIEKYYTEQEIETMMNDFWEFDRKMIHEKYNNLYNALSKK